MGLEVALLYKLPLQSKHELKDEFVDPESRKSSF
jgi:hypothetical protein